MEAVSKKIDSFIWELQSEQNFNQVLLKILSDEDIKNILIQGKKDSHFLPTTEEFGKYTDPFRESIFNYPRKIFERVEKKG